MAEQYQTKEDAVAHHREILAVIPKWGVAVIDRLHAFADGVRFGWFGAGLISGSELDEMRNELRDAVQARKGVKKESFEWSQEKTNILLVMASVMFISMFSIHYFFSDE